jgi:putative sterol carrier protein
MMAHTIESLLAMLSRNYDANQAKGVGTTIQLNVTGSEAGQWNVVIKDGKLDVTKGTHPAPELTVTADTADILAVANGEPDPINAFMAGKAKVTGDMSEAMSLIKLFKPN